MHQVLAAAMYIVTSVDSYRHSCTSQCMPNWPSCTCTFLYMMLYIHIGSVRNKCPLLVGGLSSTVTIGCFVAAIPSLMDLEALADEGGFGPTRTLPGTPLF